MSNLLPPLSGLRPHEQALAEKWERDKRARLEREVTGSVQKSSSPFQKVLTKVKQLYSSQANWDMKPEPPIECTRCKGAGYLYPPLSRANLYNRRAYPCPDCQEKHRERHRQILRHELRFKYPAKDKLLELGAAPIEFEYLGDLNLSLGEIDKAKESLNRAFLAAKEFAKTCSKGRLLVLEGPYGTAKTHLAAKIYRYAWLKHQFSVIYLSGQEFQAQVTDFSSSQYGRTSAEVNKNDLKTCDLLIIDESDRISVTDKTKNLGDSWTENQMLYIVDVRIERGVSTMLIGNHINTRLSGAIRSRIHAYGAQYIDMSDIPDGRQYFGND